MATNDGATDLFPASFKAFGSGRDVILSVLGINILLSSIRKPYYSLPNRNVYACGRRSRTLENTRPMTNSMV
jgi:hypothetical protein